MQQDRKTIIPLPVVNEDLRWGKGMNHQVFETVNNGEILIAGKRKLIELSISSFIPSSNSGNKKRYSYAKSYILGEGIAYSLEQWRDKQTPIRLIITKDDGKTLLNILVLIEHFERGLDRASDIPYELKLKQYIDLGD